MAGDRSASERAPRKENVAPRFIGVPHFCRGGSRTAPTRDPRSRAKHVLAVISFAPTGARDSGLGTRGRDLGFGNQGWAGWGTDSPTACARARVKGPPILRVDGSKEATGYDLSSVTGLDTTPQDWKKHEKPRTINRGPRYACQSRRGDLSQPRPMPHKR